MTAPQTVTQAVREAADEQIRAELAVRLTARHDAVLRRVPDLYRKIVGEALAAEQGDMGKAAQLRTAQRALDRIANLGVVDFVDQSGRRWNMQSYVEMAVRTAAMRAMVDAQRRVYRARGISLVYITRSAGQCTLCRPWEAVVVALDPITELQTVPVLDRGGDEVGTQVVAHTLDDAIAAGLFHPNCRHRVRPWRPGTIVPPATPDPEGYAAQQRLRHLERQVRHWRQREAVAVTPEAKQQVARRIEGWQAEIRRHVEATGVRRNYQREQVDRPLTSPTPTRRATTGDEQANREAQAVAEQAARDQAAREQQAREAAAREQARAEAEAERRQAAELEAARQRAADEAAEAEREAARERDVAGTIPADLTADDMRNLERRYKAAVKDAPPSELEALTMYMTSTGYMYMNGLLRKQAFTRKMNPNHRARTREMLDRLADHMDRSPELPAPVTVYRRVADGVIPRGRVVGKTIHPVGYHSTSMTEAGAPAWHAMPIVMRIVVPQGMKAIIVGGREDEMILPDGTRFVITGDERREDGKRWVTMTALPPGS